MLQESHRDPATRVLDALDRYDFKKSPIAFNILYDALEEHTLRELDATVAFESSTFPAILTVDTSEHPLCFAFALAVKLIRTSAPSAPIVVSATLKEDTVHITMHAETNGIPLKDLFAEQRTIFEHLAHIARFEILLELSKTAVSVTYSIPLYNSSSFQLHTVSHIDLADIFGLAAAYVNEITNEK